MGVSALLQVMSMPSIPPISIPDDALLEADGIDIDMDMSIVEVGIMDIDMPPMSPVILIVMLMSILDARRLAVELEVVKAVKEMYRVYAYM